MMRVPPRALVIALACVSVFAAGAGATALWLTPEAPPSLAPPTRAADAPVAVQEFSDTRSVTVTITVDRGAELEAGLSGRVTSTSCEPGGSLASGAALAGVDGRPLVALSTAVPLWRDLHDGDRGDDVEALQAELSRLGLPTPVDGRAGRGTLARVAELFARAGDDSVADAVPADRIVWLPSAVVTFGSCDAPVGSTVAAGETVATTTGTAVSASIDRMPPDLTPGERHLTVDSVTVPVEEDGTISDPAAVHDLEATPSYQRRAHEQDRGAADASGGADAQSGGLPAELSLRSPISIGVVPPSAVYALSGRTGCVASGNTPYRVEVVGSQLGRTFVRFAGESPRSVRIGGEGRPPCT